ncbi:MAG: thiolase domain-containing protein, partial [Anaerolineales bacterium]|nr:thiolase domain-containing protein [Anaerolineales bacterium]
MRDVYIGGLGLTPAGEHWETSLRELAFYALEALAEDTDRRGLAGRRPGALYVANMLSGALSHQAHLGALVADFAGLRGLEAVTVEAAGASGGAALRQAVLAVASGAMDHALVVGVEKMTDKVGAGVVAAAATAADSDWESAHGATPTALAALLMRRYLHEHGLGLKDFANFSVNAHRNAKDNPNAMFRNAITAEAFLKAGMVADPVNMFDTAPECDGAAALLVTAQPGPVRVAGSAQATDALAVHDRPDMLAFEAVRQSTARAYAQAGVGPEQIDVFELYDAYTIFSALSLEAAGFAERGQGWRPAAENEISINGKVPIATFGGLKARGNPGGATGVYQAAEVVLQLLGEAG